MQELKEKLSGIFDPDSVRENESLHRHCNWRAGGPADLFLTVRDTGELRQAVVAARECRKPVTVLGFGANVLVADKGVRGLVILNRSQRISILDGPLVEADSGTHLALLARETARQGIGGLEFLVGIPGTVGAAVAVNAGTRNEWVSGVLESALILQTDHTTAWVRAEELEFSYRNSRIKRTGEIVLSARFHGWRRSPKTTESHLAEQLDARKSQPTGPSAGSVFVNPGGDFAGRLIETCGLKGYGVGGAVVSDKHANFILNTGNATAADIRKVIEHVKAVVQEQVGVMLREEISYLGEWEGTEKPTQ